MIMKPKFRIGDRVLIIGLGDEWIFAGIDPLDSRRVYVSFDYNGTIAINEQPWYLEHELELVGCGIPAPVLRWDASGVWAKVLGAFFRIAYNGMKYNCLLGEEVFDQGYASIDEAREACQAYWQQLWDKEMLISRDLHETGE